MTTTTPGVAPPHTGAQIHDALLGTLARRIVNRAAGTDVPVGTRLANTPQPRLWLGMLASEPKLIAEAQAGYSYGERLVPPAQGFTFRVSALPVTLDLTVSATGYLALTPTLAEQRAAVTAETDTSDSSPGTGNGPAAGGGSTRGHKLAQTWSKIALEPVTVTVTIDDATPPSFRVAEDELSAAFRAAIRPPAGTTLFRPRRATPPPGSLPRLDDLVDETTWSRYCAANLVDVTDLLPPELRAAIEIEVTTGDDSIDILLTVVNTTPAADQQTFDGSHPYSHEFLDSQIYEVALTAATVSPLRNYELEQVAQSYRYDRTVPALGHGCPVIVETDPGTGRTLLRTQFAAEQQTARVYPRETLILPDQPDRSIDTSFASLIADPVGIVEKLVVAHRAWVDHHWSDSELDRLATERDWNAAARTDAKKDATLARKEVDWVAAGLELLRTDPQVRDAFVLANRTVEASAKGNYTAWRPFQVAWIVGCMPGMVDPDSHPDVDIVWFATGGGKSEAYLGLMVMTLFYGRLTGVTAGAQVWARFPLRLLALQQAERFAAIVLNAEVLRQNDGRISSGDPFGIGYFVGGGNTPNKLQRPDPTNPYYRGQDPRDPATATACRVLENCPLCDQRLEVSFDEPSWTMRHICRTANCRAAGVLPVWGIDDDIYRHAPAVLVGTVDKLAQLGQSREFQILLGRAHSRCLAHGYTSNPAWCAVFGCHTNRQPIPTGFGHIRLEIADELHLLDESLGALDGMYETLLQTISEDLGNPPMQIVGATATIEGYANQVDHLYKRPARRFPVNGPVVGETFWATTANDDPLRRYLGVRPRQITMVTATREVALSHAYWLADLLANSVAVATESGLDGNDPRVLAAVKAAGEDLYEVLVAYCLRNEDLSSFARDASVRELLASQDNLAVINGDAEPADIRSAVGRLSTPPVDPLERVKIIAATKAIGHGFDVHRLGVMAVMGTPTSAAEIIQASARVGRKHPGLVVNVINPTRDRDASVFRYYADWIRFLDRLVHKVPVNRESLPVLKRVLSGGLMAWLLQVHDRGWLTGAPRRRSLADSVAFADAVTAGYIDRSLLIDNLSRGFGVDPRSVYQQMHRDAVAAWVDDQLAALPLRAEAGKRLPDLLSPPVPRSLRDVEEPIVIYGDV
ncbi:hypothetical protein AB0F43_30935 [Kribbella sp. NPDC023972]|uniref:DEAD/DEAH box helicase family protein n=1 Tax=Kribbella sp. NPDC023972 TaxID=3154795 RepID=UPI0033D4589A